MLSDYTRTTTSRSQEQLPPTYGRRTENEPRTARGASPTRQMGVASDGGKNRGSLGTKGTPPDLPSLPDKMPLPPRSTVTCRRALPSPLLPVQIPWCVPVPCHSTQDGLLRGRKPCSRQRLFPPICGRHTARHQKGHHPSGTRRRVPEIAFHRPPTIPHD